MSGITVEGMIESLESPCVLRMDLIKYKTEKKMFIFEGDDDYGFYSSVIKYSGFIDGFDHLVGNGKSQLIELFNELIIEREESSEFSTLDNVFFFVDQDYSPLSYFGSNIFTTPCYAIENHIFSDVVVAHFIKDKFKLKSNDRAILNKVIANFKLLKKDFIKKMTPISILLYQAHLLGLNYEFPKYSDLIKGVSFDSINFKNYNYNRLSNMLKGRDSLNIPSNFKSENLIRGKYCLFFLMDYLIASKRVINDYLHEKKVLKANDEIQPAPYRSDIKFQLDDIDIATLSCGCSGMDELNIFFKRYVI